MGRTVESVGNNVIYIDLSWIDEDDNPEAQLDYDDFLSHIKCDLQNQFTSLRESKQHAPYPYREQNIFLENNVACFSISEYLGCAAISIFVNPQHEDRYVCLAEQWIRSICPKAREIVKKYADVLNKIGTVSNGCGVFEKDLT